MRRLLILFVFVSLLFQSYSQHLVIDSINTRLKELGSSRAKCEYLLDLSDLVQRPAKDFIPYILLAVDLARESGDLELYAHALKQAGYIYYYNGMHPEAILYFRKAIVIYKGLGDLEQMVNCYNMLANLYFFDGTYDKAIIANKNIIGLARKVRYNQKVITALRQTGVNYMMLGKLDSAYFYLMKAISLAVKNGDNKTKAYNFSDFGYYYFNVGDYEKSIFYQHKALNFCENEEEFLHPRTLIYNRLSESFLYSGQLDSAVFYLGKALQNKRIVKLQVVTDILAARIYLRTQQYDKVIRYLSRAESEAGKMRSFVKLAEVYSLYMKVYRALGDTSHYYMYSDLYQRNYDSIEGRIKEVQFTNIMVYDEVQRFKKQINNLLKEQKLKQEKIRRYKRITLFVGIAVLIVLAFLIQQIRHTRILKNKNLIIERQKEEIKKQAENLQVQKDYLEQQKRLIDQSLQCAFSIQKTTLPSEKLMREFFAEYYLIYRPMHIVSGDFYWLAKTSEGIRFVVIADGTGHGVPGAFISLITGRLLEEIILLKKIYQPSKILESIKTAFDKLISNSDKELLTVGLEIAVLKIQFHNERDLEVTYSGARLPFVYYEPGKELTLVRARGKSIGGLFGNISESFGQLTVTVDKKTVFYLFTDGYKDQVCKKSGKRINSKQFLNLLEEVKDLSIPEQGRRLEQFLDECMEGEEQRDDISVLIFRLS